MKTFKNIALLWLVLLSLIPLAGCRSEPEVIARPIVPYKPAVEDFARNLKAITVEPDPDGSELVEINYAADIGYIMVKFKANYKISKNWQQGDIYIIDEASGLTYDGVVVMPVIGPLFNKPPEDGATGFVMLEDPSQGIKTGSVVTAVLGRYKREHVTIK